MNVKELIKHLGTLHQDAEVVVKYTDPTDYTYITPVEEVFVTFEKETFSDEEEYNDVVVFKFEE
jgi:hypothetical protein